MDDPLWDEVEECISDKYQGLNPSFNGWPSLGVPFITYSQTVLYVYSEK